MLDLPLHLSRSVRALPMVSILLAGGCGGPKPEVVAFPSPPEQARFVFETRLGRPADIAEDSALRQLAGKSEDDAFLKPYDVAARFGRIYVTDSAADMVHVFDIARRRFFRLGYRLQGKLAKPLGVAVDQKGLVYVADAGLGHVAIYDAFGMHLRSIGAEMLVRPVAVAPSPDGQRLYVVDNGGADSDRHGILIFSATGERLGDFGGPGNGPGQFNRPVAAGVGPDGRLYVLDGGNFRVQVFDREGRFLTAWGAAGNRPGLFARPRDLAVDDEGKVYVSDAAFGNIQIFDADGRLLMAMGTFGVGDRAGEFNILAGVGVDETGRVYAVDQSRRTVSVLAPTGN